MVKTKYILLALALTVTHKANAAEGDWEYGGRMLKYRGGGGLVVLRTGDLLAVAGDSGGTAELITQRILTGVVSEGLPSYGSETIPVLSSGEALVNGRHGGTTTRLPMLYDPSRNEWRPTSQPVNPRSSVRVLTILKNGSVLGIGGSGIDESTGVYESSTRTVELYDPAVDRWTAAGSLITGRSQPGAVLLPSGKVIVFGGFHYYDNNNKYECLTMTEVYDPDTDTWSTTGDMVQPRCGARGSLISSGKVAVIGGWGLGGEVKNVELYDPTTKKWTEVISNFEGHPPEWEIFGWPFIGPMLLPTGKVFQMYHPGYGLIYDPDVNTLTSIRSKITYPWGRYGVDECGPEGFMAAVAPSGKILIAGGGMRENCYICGDEPGVSPADPGYCHSGLKELFWYDTGTPSWCEVALANGNATAMNEGVLCDDGDPATADDHCDGKGNCVSGPWDAGMDAGIDGDAEAGADGDHDADLDGGTDVSVEDGADTFAPDSGVSDGMALVDSAAGGDGSAVDAEVEVILAPGCGCSMVQL